MILMIKKNNFNNIKIFLVLFLSSILISYTHYFDHLAIVNALLQNNDEIYLDKTNLFYLMQSSLSSFLFVIINFLLKIGLSIHLLNILLTFVPTLLNISGIFLICKFITSSNFLSFLISITTILLNKNFGNIDYPTLLFSWHTIGMFAFSLSTFIFGLLTLRNLLFAYLFCLLLLSIHLVVGLWMLGVMTIASYFFIKKKNFKKIGLIIFLLSIIIFFHLNGLINYTNDVSFEFNYKDYQEYLYYIEAHRTNYGNPDNMYFEYVFKSSILLCLIFFFVKFDFFNFNKNKMFFVTLSMSIIFSGIIFFLFKIFPQLFPEIAIRIIPPRFFLVHSIIGYPVITCVVYKFLNSLFINKTFNKNFSLQLVSLIIILHLIQKHDYIQTRFNNIRIIKEDIIKENLFWDKFRSLELNGYILTSNDLCYKTITYGNLPILFCFDQLDYIPYLPKLASPVKKITNKILGLSYDNLQYRNLGGIMDAEIKKSFENKIFNEWSILKKDLKFDTIIVPKDWHLDLNLILNDRYKVYIIE